MKTIVLVALRRDSETLKVVRDGAVFVLAPQPGRSGIYDEEFEAVEQFDTDEIKVKFEAEWIDGAWKLGRRFLDS